MLNKMLMSLFCVVIACAGAWLYRHSYFQKSLKSPKFSLAIHGGAGVISKRHTKSRQRSMYYRALQACVELGERVLAQPGKTPLDAVEACVSFLENCSLFNAGRGAVLNEDGNHELDACVMTSHGLKTGSVSLLTKTKKPVQVWYVSKTESFSLPRWSARFIKRSF